jgi:hypothetical protein
VVKVTKRRNSLEVIKMEEGGISPIQRDNSLLSKDDSDSLSFEISPKDDANDDFNEMEATGESTVVKCAGDFDGFSAAVDE